MKEIIEGIVCAVHDGDSIKIDTGKAKIPVRIKNINAPEIFAPGYSWQQPYGKEAGDWLRLFLRGAKVRATIDATRDKWGRRVAVVEIFAPASGNWHDVAGYIVAQGYAWVGPGRGKYLSKLRGIQEEAKQKKKGLWADPNPISPTVWRRIHMKQILESGQKRSADPALTEFMEFWKDE